MILELIDRNYVKGATVTIDAMGCQKEIARKIFEAGGDYVLAVKNNQPKLQEAIREVFSDARQDELVKRPPRQHQTTDHGHGRKDERHYVLAQVPKGFPLRYDWPGLKTIGMAVRTTERADGTMARDVRYFISSSSSSGQRFAEAVRGHWGIENSLHWVLDVSFDEDLSRTRNRRIANNLSWLRRSAIGLLKRHPSEDSIKGKSRLAGATNFCWNSDCITKSLMCAGPGDRPGVASRNCLNIV